MLAAPLARWLADRGIHYGWVMVAITFAYALASTAAMAIPGVLMVPMGQELHWSIGEISSPLALRLFLFGAIAPLAGALMVRYGMVRMLAGASLLILIGLALSITMTAKWQLWLGMGVLLGVAPGMTAMVINASIAGRWFAQRRGLVMGMLSAANATGQLLFLPVAAWITEHWGWRVALMPSVGLIGLCALLFMLFAREHPSDLGLPAFGETAVTPRPPAPSGNVFAVSFNALRDASGRLVFWVLFGSFAVCGMSSFGLMGPHFVPLCADEGVNAVTATGLLALMGICDFIGTIASGWLSDRYDNRMLLAWYYSLRGLSLMWLPFSGFDMVGLSLFSVFFGLDYIASVPVTMKLTILAVGAARAPVVFGWIFAGHQFGAAFMAAAAGLSRDALQSYLPSFFSAGVICVLGALSMLLLRGRRNPAPALTIPSAG